MTTALDVIAVARGQVGYRETGTNITKFWAELDPAMQGSPWCAGFMSWCFKHAGAPLWPIDKPYGYVSALDGMNWAKRTGNWNSTGRYAPGELMIYGGGEHTGLCASDDGTTIRCIDGNWGDSVQEFTRSHGIYVSGSIRTGKLLAASGVGPVSVLPKPGTSHNVAQTQMVQRAVNVTADGTWGSITQLAGLAVTHRDLTSVKYLQTRVGTVADGIWGPLSEAARVAAVKRIQTAIGTAADGNWGPDSVAQWNIAVARNYQP